MGESLFLSLGVSRLENLQRRVNGEREQLLDAILVKAVSSLYSNY